MTSRTTIPDNQESVLGRRMISVFMKTRFFPVPLLLAFLLLLLPLHGENTTTLEEAWGRFKSAEVHFLRGLKEYNERRNDQAAASLQECVRVMPRHAYAHFYLADLAYIQADYQNSLTHVEQALAQLDFMQELIEYGEKQKRQTIDAYQQLLGIEWENNTSCRLRRTIEFASSQLADGKSDIELLAKKRQAQRAQQKAHYLYFFGNILFQLRRFPEALQRYREAIELNPNHVSAYNNAAAIYTMAGQHSAALTYLEKAEQMGLEDNLNMKLKYLIYEALGRPTEGILQEDLSREAGTDLGVMRFALAIKPKDIMVPLFYENCYIVCNKKSKGAVIIDPGLDDPRIGDFIKKEGLEVRAILNTHDHPDHSGADATFAGLYQAPVYAPQEDDKRVPSPPDRYLRDGETLDCGGLLFKVLQTPGHTPGSVCFSIGDYLFSGDTLFKNDIGNVWAKDADQSKKAQETLVRNIKEKLLTLPDRTRVCPGHGRTTTIAEEKANNPALRI
jgi:hydroxyacylglutathione hydrolase